MSAEQETGAVPAAPLAGTTPAPIPAPEVKPDGPPPKEKFLVVVGSHGKRDATWVMGFCASGGCHVCRGEGFVMHRGLYSVCRFAVQKAKAHLDSNVSQASTERRLREAEEEVADLEKQVADRTAAFHVEQRALAVELARAEGAEDFAAGVADAEAIAKVKREAAAQLRLSASRYDVAARAARAAAEVELDAAAQQEARATRIAQAARDHQAASERAQHRFDKSTDGIKRRIEAARRRAMMERARMGNGAP